ncbi:MAG: biotin/lipoyl-containing protein, partial [Candidatus Velthaea sp.]
MLESVVKVALPELGESVAEGSIVEWRKTPGEWVEEGETLVDVTTDKVDVEVPSTAAGVITAIHGKEGDTVAIGSVLVEIDTTARKPDATSAPAVAAAPEAVAEPASAPPGDGAAGAEAPGAAASHKAQLLASRRHVDLRGVRGSGPDGLILREDVDRAVTSGLATTAGNGAAARAAAAFAVPADAKIIDLKGAAGTLAGYMDQS